VFQATEGSEEARRDRMKTAIVELEADHPGFNDEEYRQRRDEIAIIAMDHSREDPPPRVTYTESERATWKAAFTKLVGLYGEHACDEYNRAFQEIAFSADQIPQLADVSDVLTERTGFRLRPVAGLVDPREFLSSLADRVFCATQYVRHHSRPHYTPEPDVIHELMGHAPMFAIPELADMSERIGHGARRADETEITRMASLYWYTIEFGVLRQRDRLVGYGAGLLSSYGELVNATTGGAEVRPFVPEQARDIPYPITTYQPVLWEVGSLAEACELMDRYVEQAR
jgi:phenylalanine-4-hydroxylase